MSAHPLAPLVPASYVPASPVPAPYAPASSAPATHAPAAYTPWRDDAAAMSQSGPRFFGPAARPVFGWYHAPAGRARGEAVVLCPSVGTEYLTGHRALRLLAERLSADGFAVLRFDWPGTGDSAGDAGDPGDAGTSAAEWRAALGRAVERARAWSGAARVTVVGLRAGALFAAEGAAFGADRVVLWWPPASGRQFLRELRARHALAEMDHDRYRAPDGDEGVADGSVEANGFLFAPALAREFGTLAFAGALAAGAASAGAEVGGEFAGGALVLGPALASDGPAVAAFAARGVQVDVRRVAGAEVLRDSSLDAEFPPDPIAAIATWMAERADAAVEGCDIGDRAGVAPPGLGELGGATVVVVDGAREECVRFGADARVVGVLTTPVESSTPGAAVRGAAPRPPVLLLHTGGDHHVGPNRMWPVWARRWACEGITTLRFDPAGLGDTPGDAPFQTYSDDRTAEVVEAAAYLCERTGADGVVLVGVCTGGYYAVRGAAAGARAARIVAVNPQFFAGHEELDHATLLAHRAPAVLGVAARDPARWGRVLRGETRPWRVALMVATEARRAARGAAAAAFQEVRGLAATATRRRTRVGALDDLWRVGRANVPLCLVFSYEDEGWAYLRVQVRAAWRAFRRRHAPRVHVLERAVHTFQRPWMQRRLYEVASAELRRSGP